MYIMSLYFLKFIRMLRFSILVASDGTEINIILWNREENKNDKIRIIVKFLENTVPD